MLVEMIPYQIIPPQIGMPVSVSEWVPYRENSVDVGGYNYGIFQIYFKTTVSSSGVVAVILEQSQDNQYFEEIPSSRIEIGYGPVPPDPFVEEERVVTSKIIGFSKYIRAKIEEVSIISYAIRATLDLRNF